MGQSISLNSRPKPLANARNAGAVVTDPPKDRFGDGLGASRLRAPRDRHPRTCGYNTYWTINPDVAPDSDEVPGAAFLIQQVPL